MCNFQSQTNPHAKIRVLLGIPHSETTDSLRTTKDCLLGIVVRPWIVDSISVHCELVDQPFQHASRFGERRKACSSSLWLNLEASPSRRLGKILDLFWAIYAILRVPLD